MITIEQEIANKIFKVTLKAPLKKEIAAMSPEQRRIAAEWLIQVERTFNRFKMDILSA